MMASSWSVFLGLQYLFLQSYAYPRYTVRDAHPQITAAPGFGAIPRPQHLRRQDSCTWACAVCALYAPCEDCVSLSTPAGIECCTSKLADQSACPTANVPPESTIYIYTLDTLTVFGNPTSLIVGSQTITPGGTPAILQGHTLSVPTNATSGRLVEDGTTTTLGIPISTVIGTGSGPSSTSGLTSTLCPVQEISDGQVQNVPCSAINTGTASGTVQTGMIPVTNTNINTNTETTTGTATGADSNTATGSSAASGINTNTNSVTDTGTQTSIGSDTGGTASTNTATGADTNSAAGSATASSTNIDTNIVTGTGTGAGTGIGAASTNTATGVSTNTNSDIDTGTVTGTGTGTNSATGTGTAIIINTNTNNGTVTQTGLGAQTSVSAVADTSSTAGTGATTGTNTNTITGVPGSSTYTIDGIPFTGNPTSLVAGTITLTPGGPGLTSSGHTIAIPAGATGGQIQVDGTPTSLPAPNTAANTGTGPTGSNTLSLTGSITGTSE